MPAFDVEITTTGEVIIKAEGFTGGACLSTSRSLLEELGEAKVTTDLAYVSEGEEVTQW